MARTNPAPTPDRKSSELRKRAEKLLRRTGSPLKPIPKKDVLELIHELEVHQVELEMQNEEVRRTQAELEEERKKYFDLYDLAPVGYVTLDRSGFIREINLTASEMLGRSRRYLINSRLARFIDPAQRSDFARFCQQVFETGQRRELELGLCPKDKPAMIVLLSATAIVDAGGRVHIAQVAITDITARVAAEHWRQKLIGATQDAVIAIDSREGIVVFNPAAENIFGYAADEVIGKKVNLLMAEPYQREHDRYIAHYQQTGEKRAIGKIREVAARRKNGEVFPIELSITELGENDEPRYAAFIRDVSEKAKLQADLLERTRLATIGETAAGLAHEIANPLNGLSMSVELLERDMRSKIDADAQATFNRLSREIARLKALLYDFRDLSREPRYSRSPVLLSAIVEQLCGLQRAICEAQGIEVEVEMEPGLPPVLADADRLKQVLLNLCKNAEEAMPQGGKLTVRGFQAEGRVVLEVRDTGAGIPEGVDIFRPFQSAKVGGSGLGLAIARQIVVSHGGTLTYKSGVGKGTSFFVALPITSPASTGKTPA